MTFPIISDQPYDLYILIKPQDDVNTSYFAAASSCDRSDVDNRPFFGIYFLNFAKMEGTKIKEHFYFSTFAHEFTHILGFSSSLYDKYVKPDGSPRPENEVIGSKNFKFWNYWLTFLRPDDQWDKLSGNHFA